MYKTTLRFGTRAFLALLLLSAFLQISPAAAQAPQAWSREDAAHLLRRAGFGGTPQQIDGLFALGKEPAVEYLLTGQIPPGTQPLFEHVEFAPFKAAQPDGDLQKRMQHAREETQRLRLWWVERMCRTDRPLEEKMTLFWHGLFCSGVREVKNGEYMAEQNALFHSQALGNYKKLTHAICRGPAMLRYLNADQNVRGKPNENLGRELMELFTMGEGHGYTEKDIAEVARALTGVRVGLNGYIFRRFLHDDGSKTIFGRTGKYGPDDVPNLIFDRVEPAQYLAHRLWTFFASPDPTEAEIAPVTEALRRNNYELKPALRVLFLSPDFYSEKSKFSLIRSPAEMVVGTARSLGITPGPAIQRAMVEAMERMGQQLLQPPNVRGWPGGEHWITSATLYTRYNTATTLVNIAFSISAADSAKLFPNLKGDPSPKEIVDAAIERFIQRPLNEEKKAALVDSIGPAPLHAGTRDADRRIRQMLGLLLSTPEYQVE